MYVLRTAGFCKLPQSDAPFWFLAANFLCHFYDLGPGFGPRLMPCPGFHKSGKVPVSRELAPPHCSGGLVVHPLGWGRAGSKKLREVGSLLGYLTAGARLFLLCESGTAVPCCHRHAPHRGGGGVTQGFVNQKQPKPLSPSTQCELQWGSNSQRTAPLWVAVLKHSLVNARICN